MHLPVFGGSRARRFARLLDETRGQRQERPQGPADDDMAHLVGIADRLGSLKADLQPRPGFREELRAQLMATAQREGIGATAVRNDTGPARVAAPRQRRRVRPTAGLVAASVATAAIGLTAASGAIPGDALYPIKRSSEQAQLAVAGSRVERARLLLGFAQTRMFEADAVAGNAPEMPGILDLMDAETREGVALLAESALDRHDQDRLDIIATFSAAQHSAMPDVLADITGSAHARARDSLELLNQVDTRVAGLRAYVRCADPSPVRNDELGPKPHPCPTRTLADIQADSPADIQADSQPPDSQPPDSPAPDSQSAPAPAATQASPVPPLASVPELPSPQAPPAQRPIPAPVPPARIVPAPQPVTTPTPAGPVTAPAPAGDPVTEPPLGVPDLDPTPPAPPAP